MAAQKSAQVRSDLGGASAAVNVIVATGAEGLHQGLVAAIAHGDDGNVRGLDVGVQNLGDLVRTHLAQVGSANDGSGRVPLEHGHGVDRLRAVHDFEAFLLERVAKALGEEDVAVDQQYFGRSDGGRTHAAPPISAIFSRSTISTISSCSESNPVT
jgi:hypothetical protein